MNDWLGDTIVSGNLLVAAPIALAAGLISFFSPCVVPLLPGYLSYVSGIAVQDFDNGRRKLVIGSVLFVLGFTAVFVTSGAFFGFLGLQLAEHQRTLAIVTGVLVILMGLVFMGAVPWLDRDLRVKAVPSVGLAAAPLLGFFFGLGWAPCLGPTLTAVLSLSLSTSDASAARGATLAFIYCLGLGVPFILAALGIGHLTGAIGWIARRRRAVAIVGGLMMIAVGILLVTGWWNDLVVEMTNWIGGFETVI